MYRNPDTGVYGEFALADDPGVPSPIPDDLQWTGVTFYLHYVRPTFFALETMPVVESIANELGWLVDDPQATADPGPKPADLQRLIASWSAGNKASAESLRRQGQTILHMDSSRATGWWTYMSRKPTLERLFGKRAYVPGINLAVWPNTTTVLRLLSWTEGIPLVLPPCELVAIVRRVPGGGMAVGGILEFQDLEARVGPYLQPIPDFADLRLLPPDASGAAREIFERLRPSPVEREALMRIEPDQFVDVEGAMT